jgi:pimeloyl-ACP methyl ester carboxylesterase
VKENGVQVPIEDLHGTPVRVHESFVPVSLAPGEPADERVFVRLTMPVGPPPRVVQMLSGSLLWHHGYWSVADPREGSDRYHWTAHAVRAGHATLAIDRIGLGKSSRPPAGEVTFESNLHVNYQIARALREGRVEGPAGPVRFPRVVAVSHSFSACFTEHLITRFPGAFDLAILSGWTHDPRFDNFELRILPNLVEAHRDDQFPGHLPGYLTSRWGSRHTIFFAPADSDPRLLAEDEQTYKATLTQGEMDTMIGSLSLPVDLRIPVLFAMGGGDPLFAKAPPPAGPYGTDCSSVEALLAAEGQRLGAHLPSLEGFVLPGSGHNLNVMPNAREWFAFAMAWLGRHLA